jgi:energy-coupling factor transporter ATP-binding protein EcfA2
MTEQQKYVQEILIQNVKAIQKVSVPIPKSGVVLFRGRNASGKDSGIEAINSLLAGDGKLPVRDGQAFGVVQGFDCMVTFGRQTKRAGELTVSEIASKFDIGKFVNPGINDPEAADAARIKALLRLLGIEPDPSIFFSLVGGKDEFEKIVPIERLDTADVVNMAGQVKRFIEAEARKAKSIETETAAKIKAITEDVSQINITQPHDEAFLRTEYETAVRIKSELIAERHANQKARENAQQAEKELKAIQGSGNVPTIEDAEISLSDATQLLEKERTALEEAKRRHSAAVAAYEKTTERLGYAKTMSDAVKKWQEQINKAKTIDDIPDEKIIAADTRVDKANAAISTGVLIRRAITQLELCAKEKDKHIAQATRAEMLRGAAGSVETILSSLIKSDKIQIVGGRLVTPTKRSKQTPVAELSTGEIWTLAIELTAPIVGESGAMTAPQVAWESLDPDHEILIESVCHKNKIVLISAEATDGELRAEVFEPPQKPKIKK